MAWSWTGFSLGFLSGIYVSQNYNVPKVPSPQELLDLLTKWAEDHKKGT